MFRRDSAFAQGVSFGVFVALVHRELEVFLSTGGQIDLSDDGRRLVHRFRAKLKQALDAVERLGPPNARPISAFLVRVTEEQGLLLSWVERQAFLTDGTTASLLVAAGRGVLDVLDSVAEGGAPQTKIEALACQLRELMMSACETIAITPL